MKLDDFIDECIVLQAFKDKEKEPKLKEYFETKGKNLKCYGCDGLNMFCKGYKTRKELGRERMNKLESKDLRSKFD